MSGRAAARVARLLAVTVSAFLLWFGALKLLDGINPGEEVAVEAVRVVTRRRVPVEMVRQLLAGCELVLGIALLVLPRNRVVLWATFVYLILTFSPFLFFPELTIGGNIVSLTLLGQHIAKNLALLACLYVLIELARANRQMDFGAPWDDDDAPHGGLDWHDDHWTSEDEPRGGGDGYRLLR
jgi:hypothetical protein